MEVDSKPLKNHLHSIPCERHRRKRYFKVNDVTTEIIPGAFS